MNLIIKMVVFLIIVSIITLIILISLKKKPKEKTAISYNFIGPALSNYKMYKEREVKALSEVLSAFPKFTKESLYQNINELTNRIINIQNNGYISQKAFQKSATDKVLLELRNMKQVDVSIINYENNYISVAVIYENNNKELYQLLMKMNIQNGLLYLDSYNANFWFNDK